MRFFVLVSFVLALFLACARPAFSQDSPEKLVNDAEELFARQKWANSLRKLKLAQQLEISDMLSKKIALYIGGIYAEMGQDSLAMQNFVKYLENQATASSPESFTEKMNTVFEKARLKYPLVADIEAAEESFKPYKEKLPIEFKVKADTETLEETDAKLTMVSSERNENLLEVEVKLDESQEKQVFMWDGKNKYGQFMENGDYVIKVEALRKDGWKHSADTTVTYGGNTGTEKIQALKAKARRVESLGGQKRIEYLPGKKFVSVSEKPMKTDMTGFWNYFYYIPIGAIRDGLDFPLKALLSTKYVGHVLTATAPFVGGYTAGNAMTNLDKSDYYDPVLGFDEDSWEHDNDVKDQRAVAAGVLGPVWGLAYAGVMSVVSWVGTEDGIVKGFNSYIHSNAFREGYYYRYFFPNYRSLDFSTIRVDAEALEKLETRVKQTNLGIRREIDRINSEVERFNTKEFARFKHEVATRYSEILYDLAEITIKAKK